MNANDGHLEQEDDFGRVNSSRGNPIEHSARIAGSSYGTETENTNV